MLINSKFMTSFLLDLRQKWKPRRGREQRAEGETVTLIARQIKLSDRILMVSSRALRDELPSSGQDDHKERCSAH